ncbi:uncharacterized protein LOC143258092 [Tachypleus tridentatus]|uniref:uncharacterized protein LOC143258092 n=1 Tax=Tachypleus tridentatus TaxID=6853 RepID=UPI003FD0CFA4
MFIVQNFQLAICLITSFYWTSMGYVANDKSKKDDSISVLRQGRSFKPTGDERAFFLRKGRSPVFDFLPYSYLMVEDFVLKSSEKANDPKLFFTRFYSKNWPKEEVHAPRTWRGRSNRLA